MDLLQKFVDVKIQTDNRITEADRKFFHQQQAAYQDAVTGFYQIATLWSDMCAQQKAAFFGSEEENPEWENYLVSRWWPDITVGEMMGHISALHRKFISKVASYLNVTYHLSLNADIIVDALLPEEPRYDGTEEEIDWAATPLTVLRYEDAVELILSWFDGRTFEEQAPYELVEKCHRAAWTKDSKTANYVQKNQTIKFLRGACSYGCHRGHEQWHINSGMKDVLKALAHFETGGFDPYPDGIDDLLSEERYLWYHLWELGECKKLEQIKMFKNGRMDIRFANEGYARQFVADYLSTVW